LRGTVNADTWLNEPLLPLKRPQVVAAAKRAALLSDFRKFVSSCEIIDIKVVDIGGRGWKSNTARAGYVALRQQETYRKLCAMKDRLTKDITT
jgi:hypothetical protein